MKFLDCHSKGKQGLNHGTGYVENLGLQCWCGYSKASHWGLVLVSWVGSRGGMSLSRGSWGTQMPETLWFAPHLTQTGENLALTCAWRQ